MQANPYITITGKPGAWEIESYDVDSGETYRWKDRSESSGRSLALEIQDCHAPFGVVTLKENNDE